MALSRVVIPGDGVTTNFIVNFALGSIREADVTARVGNEVDGLGNPVYRTITFVSDNVLAISGAPAAVGVNVVFDRITTKTELWVDYEDGDIINAENLNTAQKQAIYLAQEALDGVDRAIKVPEGSLGYTIDAGIADGSTLMIDGTNIVAGPNADDIQNAEGFAEAADASADAAAASAAEAAQYASVARKDWTVKQFIGDGVITNFLLGFNPGGSGNLWVAVGGVPQMQGTYSVQLITGQYYLVFSEAPPASYDGLANIEARGGYAFETSATIRYDIAQALGAGEKTQANANIGSLPLAVYDPTNIAASPFARANHTGTQSADTVVDGTTNKAYTATEKTKLSGIAASATANPVTSGTWTPTLAAGSGTITTSSASGSYTICNGICHFQVSITITTVGTGAGALFFTLPGTAPARSGIEGAALVVHDSSGAFSGNGRIDAAGTQGRAYKYDGTTLIVAAHTILIEGDYFV